MEHLNELMIKDFTNSTTELEFVKFILAKSPVLKKVRILLPCRITKDEEILMLRSLLRAPRTSPVAEIIVNSPFYKYAV